MNKVNIKYFFISTYVFIISCGTLGGVGDNKCFPTSKKNLEIAIDSFYLQNPDFKIPPKWEKFNDWSKRGYDFLESRIFYFKSSPEEMYYVTFIGDTTILADTTKICIAIRAINVGDSKWLIEDNINKNEKRRIEKRFDDEVLSKLYKYTGSRKE